MDSLRRKIVLISRGFHLAFTDTEYSEIINYIEEEYDYQYAKMGFHSFFLSCTVNDYEQQMEDAANYYGSLVDDIYSLPEGERAELIDGKFKTRLRVLARDSGQL